MKIGSITAPNPGAFTLDGTRTWLLGETAVIDPGPAIRSHVAAIVEQMPHLRTILITHRHEDHAPAAIPLRETTGAAIFAPAGVLPDEMIARRLNDGDRIEIDGESLDVIATPGHTREHVCFMTRDGDLFSGDTILGRGTTVILPPDGNMREYLDSLERLRALSPERIHPAHGPDRHDAIRCIDEYIAHRLEREQQILATIAAGARTLPAIRRIVYPDLDPRLDRGAEAQIEAHLEKLVEDGRVERTGDRIVAR